MESCKTCIHKKVCDLWREVECQSAKSFFEDECELYISEPKKGHWIGIAYDGYADGYPVYYEWECSCCGVIEEDDEPTWNYCPNCGARMDLDEVEE